MEIEFLSICQGNAPFFVFDGEILHQRKKPQHCQFESCEKGSRRWPPMDVSKAFVTIDTKQHEPPSVSRDFKSTLEKDPHAPKHILIPKDILAGQHRLTNTFI